MVEQHQPNRRHTSRHRHFFVVQQFINTGTIHPGARKDQLGATHRCRIGDTPAIGVKHGHDRQHSFHTRQAERVFHTNNETVDDVAYLEDLINLFSTDGSVDPNEVFCTGMSNGGDFCYLLACEASESFLGVAPISGMIMQDIMDDCTPSQNVGILEIHGTQDNVTYYNGDVNNQDGWGAYPSIPATIDFFVDLYNLELNSTGNFPNISNNDGSTVSYEKYGVDEECAKVWLYTVNGGGHDWPGAYGNMDIDSSREAWLFFESLCESPVAIEKPNAVGDKTLEKITDLLGREVSEIAPQILLYIYDDGSIEKKFVVE